MRNMILAAGLLAMLGGLGGCYGIIETRREQPAPEGGHPEEVRCRQVACTHWVQTYQTVWRYVAVYCCCHYSGWHYEYRAYTIAVTVRAHDYDWVCHCGQHR